MCKHTAGSHQVGEASEGAGKPEEWVGLTESRDRDG